MGAGVHSSRSRATFLPVRRVRDRWQHLSEVAPRRPRRRASVIGNPRDRSDSTSRQMAGGVPRKTHRVRGSPDARSLRGRWVLARDNGVVKYDCCHSHACTNHRPSRYIVSSAETRNFCVYIGWLTTACAHVWLYLSGQMTALSFIKEEHECPLSALRGTTYL